MAAIKKDENPLAGLESEIALAVSQAQSGKQNTTNDLLQQLLLHKLQKEQAEDAQKEEQRKSLLRRNLQMIQEQIRSKAQEQSECSHLKENNRACVGGQKLSNGHFILLCLRCQKEWDETTFPRHLAASLLAGSIGGSI